MNHTLDQFADNPIIDELVSWPPRSQAISSVRASCPLFRQPFLEITLDNGETLTRRYSKDGFPGYWAEAMVILQTLTSIELISDVKVAELSETNEFIKQILAEQEASIAEASMMFENGMYKQYLWQFGKDYKGLPPQVEQNIAVAQSRLAGE